MSAQPKCPACGTVRDNPDEPVCALCGHGEKTRNGRGIAVGVGLIVLLLALGAFKTMMG